MSLGKSKVKGRSKLHKNRSKKIINILAFRCMYFTMSAVRIRLQILEVSVLSKVTSVSQNFLASGIVLR